MPCERRANTSVSTRVHAWVTFPRQIPSVCGAFVAAMTRPCPRFPPLPQDGKEGVDGSSPSEGLALRQGLRHVWCPRLALIARLGQIWVRSSLEPVPQRLVETRARLVVFESCVEVSVTRGPFRSKAVRPPIMPPSSTRALVHAALFAGTSHRVPASRAGALPPLFRPTPCDRGCPWATVETRRRPCRCCRKAA
jgi:hypothetical protein